MFEPSMWLGHRPADSHDALRAATLYARAHHQALGLGVPGPLAWSAYWAYLGEAAKSEIVARLANSPSGQVPSYDG